MLKERHVSEADGRCTERIAALVLDSLNAART
jgi:hypothetical protein